MEDRFLESIDADRSRIRELTNDVELEGLLGKPKKLCGTCQHKYIVHVLRSGCMKHHNYEEFREMPTYKYPQNDKRSLIGLQIFDGKGCPDWKLRE